MQPSSGRITRHRLNRFGDRQLNRALHTIVNWRMIHGHEPTRHYLTRRRAQQSPTPRSAAASSATPPDTCSG
ncbi:hypothetical protein ACH47V_25490 [Micromonospora chersina]|uniref:hypothetical protein n=1 Tax=Micromonospora chersina TaxID=47854 RepID=UPI003403B9F5